MSFNKLQGIVVLALGALAACAPSGEDSTSNDQAEVLATGEELESDFEVLDRMGRPEMTNVTFGPGIDGRTAEEKTSAADPKNAESARLKAELAIPTKVVAADIRAYNKQNTFHPVQDAPPGELPGERKHAKRLLAAGINAHDTAKHILDVKAELTLGALVGDGALVAWANAKENAKFLQPDAKDWTPEDLAIITDILSEDALVVDISKSCKEEGATGDAHSFFDIERAEYIQRSGKVASSDRNKQPTYSTCGGRTMEDDIVDDILTMWGSKSFDFASGNPKRVTDGITRPKYDAFVEPHASPTSTFPYLGEAHTYAKADLLHIVPLFIK